jgi:hypothetical protein
MSFQTALTTIALSTAFGSSERAGAIRAMTTTASAAAVRPAIWVRPCAPLTASVLDRLPATPMPPNSPEARLATPVARSSWSASIR